jgi:hypothetical protein
MGEHPNVAFIGSAVRQADFCEFSTPEGSFSVSDKIITSCTSQGIDSIEANGKSLVLHGHFSLAKILKIEFTVLKIFNVVNSR